MDMREWKINLQIPYKNDKVFTIGESSNHIEKGLFQRKRGE